MDDTIGYLNPDLDLTSGDDLTALASVFKAQGVAPLYVTHGEDRRWYATFDTDEPHEQPDANIAAMVVVIESLAEPLRTVWSGCTCRKLSLGYDCGSKPWAFTQGLSGQLLGRMAAVGASRRITLYPLAREKTAEPGAPADVR